MTSVGRPANILLPEAERRDLARRWDDLDAELQSGRPLGEPWEDVRKRLELS
jgi:hypothetical protein